MYIGTGTLWCGEDQRGYKVGYKDKQTFYPPILDVITAQLVFQLPKIDKENFSTFRPEGLRQES